MKIGIPKEIKNNENRVAITPAGVTEFIQHGHTVYIEAHAGIESGFPNHEYSAAGAIIVDQPIELWNRSDMIMKVKEPLQSEYDHFRKGLLLFTYLHLANEPSLAQALIDSGVTAIAYETVNTHGQLPLLTPMSEVAGRMAVQIGAQLLERPHGGKGILLSGVPGVARGKVAIIGGGVVGTNAAKLAVGLGADVTIIDLSLARLRQLDDIFGNQITTLVSNTSNITKSVAEADLLIGAVLIPGAKAPRLVTENHVKMMKSGSVIVDVAIDQGGIVETIDHITTHDNPTYVKHGVIHYAVANMPGAVPQTSTVALTNATIPFALLLANHPIEELIHTHVEIESGANVINGFITYEAVARDLGYEYVPASKAFTQFSD
ncbi:alanine dehydrogenase [Paenibacillus crassostreae]|uniref:Alanine dehydrogenase n=1 Tax=Paenibacillus crassostreae TaxID=1763538 RepID=A0A167B7P9_9BACL|nr:alanine dehydrogenase [Paenibacillus crassostreae]AOZ93101.1 alanine dehydrogenase [Paenibacillus crassostreae]OAB71810.1 alanine dehydrogenase [Paenibacillus crassostreae]